MVRHPRHTSRVLDLDTENKARGSLAHYFPQARKVNLHTSDGLDAFVDVLDKGTPIVIADMGAGRRGGATLVWFDVHLGRGNGRRVYRDRRRHA